MSKDQEFDLNAPEEEDAVKIIILGDSAVGKTKLLERFLLDKYHKQQLSTYALTIFPFEATVPGMGTFPVRFWDTAGQDIFENIHPSYYFGVHAAILCFDVTRKLTYTNMKKWWDELQAHSPNVPAICVANKIDADPKSTTREYGFAKRLQLPLYYVSASTGVNVVKMFTDAINLGRNSKLHPQDPFMDELMKLIRENKTMMINPTILTIDAQQLPYRNHHTIQVPLLHFQSHLLQHQNRRYHNQILHHRS
ncbi:MAG: putative Rabl2a protein [Streblomastix strix]|uniref:Putative Rabl2a protein n=1 Tax=Streblomastix strix TaxID=222440 RepID=A0A5J4WM93_9EUKA|nr:MAG: putative Rabl2a protein [Streblomastix strix]